MTKSLCLSICLALISCVATASEPKERKENQKKQMKAVGVEHPIKDGSLNTAPEKIDPYQNRFKRTRPVIAVVSHNSGTEITDFVVPYGILSRSGVAEVTAVSTERGVVNLDPLRMQSETDFEDFDKKFPDGADYVVVPMIMKNNDPKLLAWILSQAKKGASIVSVCKGSEVVAQTGLMNGKRATGYFYGEMGRAEDFPKVKWERNIRYVADGKIISSAGISASLPLSIALVEAIAGNSKASALAKEIGVIEWGSKHDSDYFQDKPGKAKIDWRMMRKHDGQESIGVRLNQGIDEISLAFISEVYNRSVKGHPNTLAENKGPIKTLSGLLIIPDKVIGEKVGVGILLPSFDKKSPVLVLDDALSDVAKRYGRSYAENIARFMEYPAAIK